MNDDKVEILIVDDAPENLELLGRILELADFSVRPATSGQAALQSAQAALPDLILLDLAMPVMDGFETCRRLKANPATKDVPVIFLTGQGDIEKIVQGFELGAVDYITKPFNTTELLRRVSTHIELYQLQRSLSHEVETKTDEVQDAQEHMERANQVYSSFVPREFLTLLQHDNILDVQLGDQVQTEMCVLFCDIIAFTSLSEKLGPEDSFRFINAYLSWISPIVRMALSTNISATRSWRSSPMRPTTPSRPRSRCRRRWPSSTRSLSPRTLLQSRSASACTLAN